MGGELGAASGTTSNPDLLLEDLMGRLIDRLGSVP